MSNLNDFVIKNGILKKYVGPAGDVVVPDGVTAIGARAFYRCESLENITIPDGVTSIGDEAFLYCTSLKSIELPESVTTIGEMAFFGCKSLENITLPDGVTTIGGGAFDGCESLKSIELPDGVTTIGGMAFWRCESLENITIPESVITIGKAAFSFCTSLASITLPDSVTTIGARAFSHCKSLASITLPECVTKIDDGAFHGCESLENITIPDGVTTIGEEAFSWCHSLKSIELPEGVTTIGEQAFFECLSLESIELPESVTTIGDKAFLCCKSLKSITIPAGVTMIGDEAFFRCESLESITIPAGVTTIGEDAFLECESLKSITLPESVTTIGGGAFFGCESLENITLPAGVTTIGGMAFSHCKSLASITLPDSVTTIGERAFRYCAFLESITLPEGVTTIGKWVFSGCNLQAVILPQRFYSELKHILQDENLGVALKNGENWNFYAYAGKERHYITTSNMEDYVYTGKWSEYDLELINNGPVYKYKAPARLLGMLGRLVEPVELTEENRALHMEYLTKNAKKLVALAESINCPAIVRLMFELGIVNDKNKKALVKLLEASPVAEIAALAGMNAAAPASAAPAGEAPAAKEEESELAQLYARKWEEIKGDRILKDMKLRGVHMPEMKLADGSAAPEKLFLYILVSYGRQLKTGYVLEPEADEAAKLLAYDSLCDAMEAVSGNLDGPAYPSVLPMICRFGSPRQIARLLKSRKEWGAWHKYGAKGRTAQDVLVKALVLSDKRAAVVFLEKQEGLSRYAALRGQSVEEVYENYLFDFGFDENGVRLFELGETVIEATLTPDIKIALLNRTTGKAVRSIPKKNIDPAEQKKAANELDDMRQNLKKALKIKQQQLWEDYLEAVAYPAESWKKSYLSNPFLRQIGRLLVWEQEGNTFVLTETGAVTCSGAAYAITDAPIRMAHPMEMNAAEVEAWQKYFISRGLKQPFEQIWEPVHDAAEIHLDRYADCHIPVVYLKNQQRRGIDVEWYVQWYDVNIKGFFVAAYYERTDDSNGIEIEELVPEVWNRRANMVISYLDRITVYDRVKKDDVSVINQMERFTPAQLGEFISLAQENGAVNVTALLMEYKNARFPDFDPLAEFVLE